MTEDIVRANHHNPDEEEEYYREQLAYLDTMQTGSSKPQPQGQAAYSYPRYWMRGRTPVGTHTHFGLNLKESFAFTCSVEWNTMYNFL